MPKPLALLDRPLRPGDTCRDRVTGNWAEVKEIDGGRVRIRNPYINLGWRDLAELEGPVDEYWRKAPAEMPEEGEEDA